MVRDILTVLPETLLVLGALVVLIGGSFTARRRQWRLRVVAAAAALASGVTAAVALAGPDRTAFHETFVADSALGAVRVSVALALVLVLAMAGPDLRDHPRESDACALLLLSSAGTLLVAGAADLALLVVSFVLASIPLYALVGLLARRSAAEAAMKTYLVGALSGIWLMLGAGLLTGLAGRTAYAALGGLASDTAPVAAVAAGVVLVVGGLMFKAGGVPAHTWVPDAAQGSSTTVAAFLTTIPKLGAVVAVARLLQALPAEQPWWALVGVLAVASMTVGNLGAFPQTDVRRLLGWSTISQVGYLLAAAAVVNRSDEAWPALSLFVLAYAITNLTAFAVVAAAPERRLIDDWRGAGRNHPWLVAVLAVGLLGLVGTPPTAVFVAKLATIAATWEAGAWWLAVALVANTIASLYYYLRWLAPAVLVAAPDPVSGTADRHDAAVRSSPARTAVLAATGAIAVGLLAGPVLATVGG